MNSEKLDAQRIEMLFQTDESIIFCFDGKEEAIPLKLLSDSGLMHEILLQHPPESPSSPLIVTLPKWVSSDIFTALSEFLHNRSLSYLSDTSHQLSDQSLQRLLWAGDYFQIEEFQLKCIQEVLIPRIRVQNCLLFINEAFKKLRACENSCDVWYMLLNTGMNFAAKHILVIFNTNQQELLKTNSKILEEIIERALKYYRKKETLDYAQMVQLILAVRKLPDCFNLLSLQRKNLFSKKINFQNHPSISWKLSNLSSIINKETNSFKFNDYQWKLVAKMEDDKVAGKILRIYLRLENTVNSSTSGRSRPRTAESEQSVKESADSFKKIVSVYFLLRLNQEECAEGFTVKHIVLDKSPQILLLEFQQKQLLASENKKLEFTVYLNTDFVYALVLQYISKSLDSFTSLPEFGTLSEDDILTIIRSLPSTPQQQEKALTITQLLLNQQELILQNPLEILKAVDYGVVNLTSIISIQNSPAIRSSLPLSKFIEVEVNKKRIGANSPHWQPQQSSLTEKNRESNRNEGLGHAMSPFEAQKRDTEGPSDEMFAVYRPENNFRQYLQRNDSQDFRKKAMSQDQFGLKRNISEDTQSGSYAFSQNKVGGLEIPSNKLDKFKKAPSNNSSIKSNEFQQQFSVSSSISEQQSTAFQASPAPSQQSSIKNFGSGQKPLLSSPNVQPQFPSKINQLNQQNSQANFTKGVSLVSPQLINSHSSPPQQSLKHQPPLPPQRLGSVNSAPFPEVNALHQEREARKRQLLGELDLKKYILNPKMIQEMTEVYAS